MKSTPSPVPSADAQPLEAFFRSLDRGTSVNFFGVQQAARRDAAPPQAPSFSNDSLSRFNVAGVSNSPSPPPGDDDPDLTPEGEQSLVNAFLDHFAVNVSWLGRPALRECLSSPSFSGDSRYVALYRHPLFLAAAHWGGARLLLDMGGASPVDRSFSHTWPLAALLPRLEKNFVRLLRKELSRFWTEVNTGSGTASSSPAEARPELLQHLNNLALLVTLVVTLGFFFIVMSRTPGSRVFIRLVIAILRRTRVPGEAGFQPPTIDGVDDLLIWHHWLDVFWVVHGMEILTATTGGHTLAYDPTEEFPTVPFPMGAAVLSSIPPPSTRPVNGPVPFDSLPLGEPYKCREYLGWTNPTLANPVDDPTRDLVIAKAFVSMETSGTFHLAAIIFELMGQTESYTRWLKDEAGLTLLAVLVAEQRLEAGGLSPGSSTVSSDSDFIMGVMHNPYLGEAIRRRRHLWNSATIVESRLPTELRDAAREADIDTILRLLSVLPGASGQQVLSFLLILRQTMMLLVSPEPFKDLLGDDYSSSGRSISDDSSMLSLDSDSTETDEIDAEDSLLEEWFTSLSFLEASRNALLISRTMRKLSEYITNAKNFKPNFAIFAYGCITASHAAWFHLLVLRRFRNLVAGAAPTEQARALDLYDDMVSDVQSCLLFIDASGQPQYAATRDLLNELLEGQSVKLDREQVQLLRMAQQTVHFCEHMEDVVLDGHCFQCAAERARARIGESGDLSVGGSTLDGTSNGLNSASFGQDPIGDMPELAMLGSLRLAKRVRFAATVEVQETYSKEEYPGRSMMAADPQDDNGNSTGANSQDFSLPLTALQRILQQRDGDQT